MADPTASSPRELIVAELITHAERDPTFRAQLLTAPRATVEQALGIRLPAHLTIQVHEETPHALHLVLPLAPAVLARDVIGQTELGDREVAGFADKGDPSPNPLWHYQNAGSDDIPTD